VGVLLSESAREYWGIETYQTRLRETEVGIFTLMLFVSFFVSPFFIYAFLFIFTDYLFSGHTLTHYFN